MGKASKNPRKIGRRMKVSSAGSHTVPHPAAAATAPAAAAASADDTAAASALVTCTHGAVGRDTVAFQERTAAIAKYEKLKTKSITDYLQKNDYRMNIDTFNVPAMYELGCTFFINIGAKTASSWMRS
jgi:pyocin large subunit-like protein